MSLSFSQFHINSFFFVVYTVDTFLAKLDSNYYHSGESEVRDIEGYRERSWWIAISSLVFASTSAVVLYVLMRREQKRYL
jgi:hypothetical protein